jgi:hypothetical protein
MSASKSKLVDGMTWLERATGKTILLWINRLQKEIGRASGPVRTHGKYKGHSDTDNVLWGIRMVKTVASSLRKNKGKDENMGLAAALGMILVAWYVRVQRAKAMDPKRPVELRKKALERGAAYVAEINKVMHDDSIDPIVWPGQEWENPFHPKARDGRFV